MFDVSEETIRRDLKALEQTGLVQRVRGGVIAPHGSVLPPIADRLTVEAEAKSAIARRALDLVGEDAFVFLATSSTTLTFARALASARSSLRIATTMLDAALALGADERNEVALAGGFYSRALNAIVGSEVASFLEQRLFDLAFVGVSALDAEHGMLGPSLAHRVLMETIRRRTRRLVVLADHTKFGRPDHYEVLALARVDAVVTDREPPPLFRAALEQAGGEILVAEAS